VSAVLVSHPHVASFAVGVAGGLARAGRLSLFATGVAFTQGTRAGQLGEVLAERWPVLRNRALLEVPADRLRALPLVEIGARLTARALGALGGGLRTYDALFVAHDAAVALLSWPAETTAVYAYEDAALRTFGKAKRRDLRRIWDLPLPHYRTIESLWRAEAQRWPEALERGAPIEPAWKRRRKDRELALATTVVVASAFTKKSLEGLDLQVPIAVIPYGFPTDLFERRGVPPRGRFTVLSVGTHDLRKGTPYLLEAWRRAAIPDAELHLVGPLKLAKPFVDRYAGLFRHSAHLPKSDLGAHYAGADLLAFPTLGDGFGLVMQEAMCCGTPVVTTPCGGGPECITDGVDGWVVPPRNIDALVERLRDAAANRDRTFAVGAAARARAERWTWRDSGDALVRALDT
jgi:glycosyltransferase involved in cell wall biosynthesis